jgi:hypothetical protein
LIGVNVVARISVVMTSTSSELRPVAPTNNALKSRIEAE